MNVGCVVKAAGRSSRFGRNKLLAELGGKPVLSHVLDALPKERFSRLAAIVSNPQVDRLCHAHGVDTIGYSGGPVSETVRLGVAAMSDLDGCMFVAGDQPLCGRDSYTRLLSSFAAAPDHCHRLSFGKVAGAPVLFPRRLFPRLAALTGEQGGMAAASGEPIRLIPADFAWELWDADTEQALAELEKCLNFSGMC